MKNKATENTEGTERRLEKLAKFTGEIAETGEEARGGFARKKVNHRFWRLTWPRRHEGKKKADTD